MRTKLSVEVEYDRDCRVFLINSNSQRPLKSERRKREIVPLPDGRYRAVGERELWDVLTGLAEENG